MKTEKKLLYLIKAATKRNTKYCGNPGRKVSQVEREGSLGLGSLLTKTVRIGASRNVDTEWGVGVEKSSMKREVEQ